eukprot:s1844_g6.t2
MSDRSRTPHGAADAGEQKPQEDAQADSDDDIVHFTWQQGQVLDSRYRVEDLLGDGAFGRVLRATDLKDDSDVSLKVIRDVERYRENAMIEAKILEDIREADPNRTSYCVMMSDTFLHQNAYFVMVCELLGDSLYDFLKWNGFRGFWLHDIQNFAKQSLKAAGFAWEYSPREPTSRRETALSSGAMASDISSVPLRRLVVTCETRLPAACEALADEQTVLGRMIYKSRNQHRRHRHHNFLSATFKALDLLLQSVNSLELRTLAQSVVEHSTSLAVSSTKPLSAMGNQEAAEKLLLSLETVQGRAESLQALTKVAGAAFHPLVRLGFFVPLALCATALLGRVYSLSAEICEAVSGAASFLTPEPQIPVLLAPEVTATVPAAPPAEEDVGEPMVAESRMEEDVGEPCDVVENMAESRPNDANSDSALKFLHDLSLTHTDLKPENILLQSREAARVSFFPRSEFQPPSERYRNLPYARPASNSIKLIDFGNATYVDMHHSSIIQTRQYRSPEVILQIGWSEKADIWSLGCILFELYTGNVLFDTHASMEHLGMIDRILGHFPVGMLSRVSEKAKKRFVMPSGQRLMWPEAAVSPESERYVFQQWPLENRAPQDHQAFVAFVRDLLTHDPSLRPEAAAALSSDDLTRLLVEVLQAGVQGVTQRPPSNRTKDGTGPL